jgi:hypothetical protein
MPTSLAGLESAEQFGLGFGADMGTTMHGDEWPGFFLRTSKSRVPIDELLLNVAGARCSSWRWVPPGGVAQA